LRVLCLQCSRLWIFFSPVRSAWPFFHCARVFNWAARGPVFFLLDKCTGLAHLWGPQRCPKFKTLPVSTNCRWTLVPSLFWGRDMAPLLGPPIDSDSNHWLQSCSTSGHFLLACVCKYELGWHQCERFVGISTVGGHFFQTLSWVGKRPLLWARTVSAAQRQCTHPCLFSWVITTSDAAIVIIAWTHLQSAGVVLAISTLLGGVPFGLMVC
jgi:hypothetical protein